MTLTRLEQERSPEIARDDNAYPQIIEDEKSFREIDLKTVISLLVALAFCCGWIYNIGYFSVVNYDFMSFVTINDYALSTLKALPLLLFMFFVSMGAGFVFGVKRGESEEAQGKRQQRPVTVKSQLRVLASSTAPALLMVTIMNSYRGYWEVLVFIALGMLAYAMIIIVSVTMYASLRSNGGIIFYGWLIGFSFLILAIIGADGAADARDSLKAESDTRVHIKNSAGSSPYLVRQISGGSIVLYPGGTKIGFIPSSEIQYFESDKKDNRMFDWRSVIRTFQR